MKHVSKNVFNFYCMKHVHTNTYVCHTKYFKKDVFDLLGFCAVLVDSFVSNISGLRIGLIFKGQDVEEISVLKLNMLL